MQQGPSLHRSGTTSWAEVLKDKSALETRVMTIMTMKITSTLLDDDDGDDDDDDDDDHDDHEAEDDDENDFHVVHAFEISFLRIFDH